MDLRQLVQDYCKNTDFMQVATFNDGQPWICTVTFASDDDLNLYWVSNKDRRHSIEILQNATVAVAIVKSTDPKQALQITGTARMITSDASAAAHQLYEQKFGANPRLLEVIQKNIPSGPAYWVIE